MDREKIIFRCQATWINPNFFVLFVLSSAGTYIKEFVHGDLGRTVPNVGTLLGGNSVDILQLDVIQLYGGSPNEETFEDFSRICKQHKSNVNL